MSKTIGDCGKAAVHTKDSTCTINIIKCCQKQCEPGDTGCMQRCYDDNIICCTNNCNNIGNCGKTTVPTKDSTCLINTVKCCQNQCKSGDTGCMQRCYDDNIVCCTNNCSTMQSREDYRGRNFSGIGIL